MLTPPPLMAANPPPSRRRQVRDAAGERYGVMALFAMLALAGTANLILDLDGDGRPDRVRLLPEGNAVTVLVRYGDPRRPQQRFHFVANSSREDAICSPHAKLRVEGKAFALVDGICDSIHFFWNRKTHRLDWWRL